MSKADEINLEESIKWIKERIVYIAENCDLTDLDNKRAYDSLKAVLNYIDNSISKEVIKEKNKSIRDERSKLIYKTYLKREDIIRDDSVLLGKEKILQELLEGK